MADRYEPYITLPEAAKPHVQRAAAAQGYPSTNAYLSARLLECVADDLNVEKSALTGGN